MQYVLCILSGNAAYIKSHNNPSFKIVRDYNGLNKKIYLNGYVSFPRP